MISCRVSVLLFCWEGFFLRMCNILPSGSILEIDLSEAVSKPVTAVSSLCTFVWISVPATRHPLCFRVALSPCLNRKRIMRSVFIFSDSSGKNVLQSLFSLLVSFIPLLSLLGASFRLRVHCTSGIWKERDRNLFREGPFHKLI